MARYTVFILHIVYKLFKVQKVFRTILVNGIDTVRSDLYIYI